MHYSTVGIFKQCTTVLWVFLAISLYTIKVFLSALCLVYFQIFYCSSLAVFRYFHGDHQCGVCRDRTPSVRTPEVHQVTGGRHPRQAQDQRPRRRLPPLLLLRLGEPHHRHTVPA